MSDPIYTATVQAMGGRQGVVRSDDGHLEATLAYPPALGGDGAGTNPEQLFAAGYAACFLGALGVIARQSGVSLGDHSLGAQVDLIKDETSFHIGVRLTLTAPALSWAQADDLLHRAHEICPYSRAIRGNVRVELAVARA